MFQNNTLPHKAAFIPHSHLLCFIIHSLFLSLMSLNYFPFSFSFSFLCSSRSFPGSSVLPNLSQSFLYFLSLTLFFVLYCLFFLLLSLSPSLFLSPLHLLFNPPSLPSVTHTYTHKHSHHLTEQDIKKSISPSIMHCPVPEYEQSTIPWSRLGFDSQVGVTCSQQEKEYE